MSASRDGPSSITPALLTTVSRRPSSLTVRSTKASAAARSVTSTSIASALPPASSISSTNFSRRSSRRAATATAAPSAASRFAAAPPIPLEAPVTRATVPERTASVAIPGAYDTGYLGSSGRLDADATLRVTTQAARARDVRAAPRALRRARRRAQLLPGSALAQGRGRGRRGAPRGPRPRRRLRHRPGQQGAGRTLGMPRRRARPERRDARPRAGEGRRLDPARRADRAGRGRGRVAALRRRRVRPPHLHLPAALRRRPGRDPARAGPGGEARRARLELRVLPAAGNLAAALAPLHPGRPADSGTDRLARLVRGGALPRAEHRRFLPLLSAGAAGRALARGGDRRRQGEADEPRRRGRDLGHGWRLTGRPVRPSTRWRPAAPATSSTSCTRPTPAGT